MRKIEFVKTQIYNHNNADFKHSGIATSTYLFFENYYSRHKNTDKTLYEQEHSEHIFPGDFLYISYNIINTT